MGESGRDKGTFRVNIVDKTSEGLRKVVRFGVVVTTVVVEGNIVTSMGVSVPCCTDRRRHPLESNLDYSLL